ncbi:MAG: HNH endonuclease [Ignavibacterium sp.]|nr:HNH endonuclease [Ignavibacterium sp.]
MRKSKSKIPFDYITVKTTQSRIEKGLLAIPVSLIDLFPKSSTKIFLLDGNGKEEAKKFTPYNSSSRECRIGGLKEFYAINKVQDGDELVIQLLDDSKYKIIPEKIFEKEVLILENKIQKSKDETEINNQLHKLSKITNRNTDEVIKSEFVRLANEEISNRKVKIVPQVKIKENVPLPIRKILLELYKGKCQVSNFTFLMKNGNPYFEIHHIDPYKGNHLKNLLVVSPNVHSQFTFAKLEQKFDEENWLRKVKFNDRTFSVFQMIDKLPKFFGKEVHY